MEAADESKRRGGVPVKLSEVRDKARSAAKAKAASFWAVNDWIRRRGNHMSWHDHPWAGVFAATLCPFHEDESIDEEGLRSYIAEVAGVPGIKGVTCNGHTGEVMSLRPQERAQVTSIVAEAARGHTPEVKVISGFPPRKPGGDRSCPGCPGSRSRCHLADASSSLAQIRAQFKDRHRLLPGSGRGGQHSDHCSPVPFLEQGWLQP